jgi:ribosomal protein L16 Arg81 hydroxylase
MATNVYLLDDSDRRWIAENLVRGGDPDSMAQALVDSGRDRTAVAQEMQAALAHPYVSGAIDGRDLWVRRLHKAQWTLEALRVMDLQDSSRDTVAIVDRLTTEEFYQNYYFPGKPVLINGCMADWPAMTSWSPDYFTRRWGDAVVDVQTGRDSDAQFEERAHTHVTQMRFADVVARITAGPTNDIYMTARNSDGNRKALPGLWDDIGDIPEYLTPQQPRSGFFWFGPQGTITPAHHDMTNNMMAQVIGRKRVRIVSAVAQPHMYNHFHVFSQVDLANVDYERFPQMKNVRVLECVLNPGQLLFLPVGCWHHVEALDVSVTMTFTNFHFENDYSKYYKSEGSL